MDDKWLGNRCLLDFQIELETVFCWIPIFCWVYNVEPDSNSREVHRQLIHNRHPVDVALVGVGLLRRQHGGNRNRVCSFQAIVCRSKDSPVTGHSGTSTLPVHHQGWMICDQETVLCWVPVP
jgi:hypothetical protein